jgi:hypothetical protein
VGRSTGSSTVDSLTPRVHTRAEVKGPLDRLHVSEGIGAEAEVVERVARNDQRG